MLESLLTTITATSTTLSTGTLLSTLCVTLLLGALVSLVHMKTNKSTATSQGFSLTLVMLPAVIAIIILLVGTNIASAFSLAGAFSIIRFRSAPGNPKDITYVLFSMAVGLAGGMGFLLQAFLIAIVLCGIMTILELTKFGSSKSTAKLLKITIPENLNYQNAFDDVMKKYTLSYGINKVKTVDMGSLFELEYSVAMKNDVDEKSFIDELRCRNGNLNITLVLNQQISEF